MATTTPVRPTQVSGHVFKRDGKLRPVWIAKWRDAAGQHKKVLGRHWSGKGEPPTGHLRQRDAEAQLEAILTDARRGIVEQLRTGVTFDVVADEWIAWGIRERDWKPSSLSDYRSILNAHLLPAFRGKRIEKIDTDEIEQWRDELVDECDLSRRTANKMLIVLGAIFERAVKTHGLLRNPVREVAKFRVRYDPNAYDFFSPDEIEQLSKAATSPQDRAI